MPGVGKTMAGAGASLSLAGGGEFVAAADRAVRAGTSSVAIGGETFLVAGGGELLAVAVRAGTSSAAIGGETFLVAGDGEPLAAADGGEARITGGGYIGTSGAIGGGGDEPLAVAGLPHRLRPPQRHIAAGGEPWSVTEGGGASEV